MSRTRTIIKWSLIVFVGLIITVVSFGFWFISLLPEPPISKEEMEKTNPSDLPYLTEDVSSYRGKVLAVVTSCAEMGNSGKSTGYELTELARAYYVFEANGYEVDVASPLGGEPPVVIDSDDMKEYDYAFLNDSTAQRKVTHSKAMEDIDPGAYQGIYFVGGKGAMFDFPRNKYIQSIVKEYYESGKVVGAVCHGPAALVNVVLTNGQHLLADRTISSFTNEEELFLIPEAKDVFPFLLQEKLTENGARFNEGTMYLNQVSQDGKLVTGQNPWSTWEVAETFVEQLGHTPKVREITPEENSISILSTYENDGYIEAKNTIKKYCSNKNRPIDRELLAVHGIVAAMQLKITKAVNLIRLLSYSNSWS